MSYSNSDPSSLIRIVLKYCKDPPGVDNGRPNNRRFPTLEYLVFLPNQTQLCCWLAFSMGVKSMTNLSREKKRGIIYGLETFFGMDCILPISI